MYNKFGMQESGRSYTVIGLDPGIDRLGWAIIQSFGLQQNKCLAHGLITTNRKESIEFRLKELYEDVITLIQRHQPTAMYIEKLFFATNKTTAMTVSEVRGVLKLCATQEHIPLVEIHPKHVKKYLVGTGNASKEQVQFMVKKLFTLENDPLTDDVADAIAIAYLGALEQQQLDHSVVPNIQR